MPKRAGTPPRGSKPGRRAAFVAGVVALLAFAPSAFAQDAGQPDAAAAAQNRQAAIDLLKGMATYVGGQQDIVLKFDSELEVVTPQLEKLQFNSSGEARISRPDKFRVSRTGGYADVELIYDGKSMTVFDKGSNRYASEPMSGAIDSVIDRIRNDFLLDLPAADLLIADSFNALTADVVEARHIGRAVVDGITCEHLAFRNHDTDWQLWVETGAQPTPCKMVITSKTVAAAPQYTIRFTDWETGDGFPPDTFTFVPPAGAKEVAFKDLANIDELPPSAALASEGLGAKTEETGKTGESK